MADVFIIASKKDRSEVVKLSKYLNNRGVNTIWDDSLSDIWWWEKYISLSTVYKNNQKKQMDDAEGSLVIWSEDSINNDNIRSQALHGLLDRKLISVRTSDIRESSIPKPFAGMDVYQLEESDKISNAFRQLIKPPLWKIISDNILIIMGLLLSCLLLVNCLLSICVHSIDLVRLTDIFPNYSLSTDTQYVTGLFLIYMFLLLGIGGKRLFQANYVFHNVIAFPIATHFGLLLVFPVISVLLVRYILTSSSIALEYLIIAGVLWCALFVFCVELIISCHKVISESRFSRAYDVFIFICIVAIYSITLLAYEKEYKVFQNILLQKDNASITNLEQMSSLMIIVFLLTSLLMATYFLLTQISQRKVFSRLITVIVGTTILSSMIYLYHFTL